MQEQSVVCNKRVEKGKRIATLREEIRYHQLARPRANNQKSTRELVVEGRKQRTVEDKTAKGAGFVRSALINHV